MTPYHQLKKIFKKISHLQYLQRILMWDESVMMPIGSGNHRASAIATLNSTIQKMLINKKVKKLIELARHTENFDEWNLANFNWMDKQNKLAASIPTKLNEKMTKASLLAEQAWRQLRAKNDWQNFLPYLEKSFEIVKEYADRRSQVLNLSLYDVLIDEYAPGFNQTSIDNIFSELKNAILPLIQKILIKQENETVNQSIGAFPIEKQKLLGLQLMKALGFDFQHGRLDESHHPFSSGGPLDARITTRYREDDFFPAIFGICHETGHALYEQGLPKQWLNQPVGKVNSMAMHESQSLLIEMEVCCSFSFFEFLTPLLCEQFGQQDAFTSENLYKLVTKVRPSLIRVDADEVTYPLHVILRYELEKELFSGKISIKDLPARWDELMVQYLGVSTKENYKDGVMQDVHWPSGAFGYFPAYTLGRLIASQIFSTFKNFHPGFEQQIRMGDFQLLNNWLRENVYSRGSLLSVDDLLTKITGNSLKIEHFIEHIKNRYLT
jgi:carboxypeptidase Taq